MEGSDSRHLSAEYCILKHDFYKLCPDTTCVPIAEHCPCQTGELQCSDGRCLPYHDICNVDKPCREFDKEYCSKGLKPGLPISVVVVIVSALCVFTVLIILSCLGLFYMRRKRNDTFQESRAALKESEINPEVRSFDSIDKNFKTRHKHSEEGNIIKWNNTPENSIIQLPNKKLKHNGSDERDKTSAGNQMSWTNKRKTNHRPQGLTHNVLLSDTIPNTDESFRDSGVNLGDENDIKLGQYIYKPRSRKPPTIYHSYVPSHTEPSTPTSVDFDREKIPFLFAQEFLCASTPRQVVKQFLLGASPDIKFIDEC